MNTIAYEIDGKRQELQFPDSVAEMTGEQLIVAARHILSGEQLKIADLAVLTGVNPETLDMLSSFQLYSIRELFYYIDKVNRAELDFKDWKIDSISVGDDVWYGPYSNFANITWGEFIYVDQCYINGYHRAMVAAMFRPERKGYDGETDRRIPFTTFGTSNRFKALDNLDPAVIAAIILNYSANRKASLESAYPQIFPPVPEAGSDDSEPDFTDDNGDDTGSRPAISWTRVHRELMGENIHNEEQYLRLYHRQQHQSLREKDRAQSHRS